MTTSGNIVLTGFMGTGKSTVGRSLAARLERPFVDTDEVIARLHGPIPGLFAQLGESGFREVERRVAAEFAARSCQVIATGGKTMLDSDNAALLGRNACVVCLVADVDTLVDRLLAPGEADRRPLLAGPDPRGRIEALLAERSGGYGRFVQVDTTGRHVDQIVDQVLEICG